jgi:hypothetical protein
MGECAMGEFNPDKRTRIFSKTDGCCYYCGCKLSKAHGHAQIDHLTPRTRGGSNDDSNFVGACIHCNASKKTRTLEEYRVWVQNKEPLAQARAHLLSALDILDGPAGIQVPFTEALFHLLEHIEKQTPPVVFYGETLLSEAKR